MSEVGFEQLKVQEIKSESANADFLSALHEFMDAEEIQTLKVEDNEGFQILNREQAGFFIRKVEEARRQAAEIKAEAEAERKRLVGQIDKWEQAELRKCATAESYLINLLETFAAKELEGKAVKTVNLPYGKLSFKKQGEKFEYDDTKLVAFLEKNKLETFISRKPSAKKTELKEAGAIVNGKLILNGKPVDGITVSPAGPDSFSVKIND